MYDSIYKISRIGKSRETKGRWLLARDWREGEMQSNCLLNVYGFAFRDDENI